MFYHGTTTALNIDRVLLPPCITGCKRESWRSKSLDKVFFTNSLLSAKKFAKKASDRYGGDPVVYIVNPIGKYYRTVDAEYIADKALILGRVK